jgi:hypothetical protein
MREAAAAIPVRGPRHEAASMKPATTPAPVDPLTAFQAQCEARALLYLAGELDLHEALDTLQSDAETSGLVRMIGQDAIQAILANAFAPHRDDPWNAPGWHEAAIEYQQKRECRTLIVEIEPERLIHLRKLMADRVSIERVGHELNKSARGATATLQTAQYLVSLGDHERLERWLARHSKQERAAILRHLEGAQTK